MKHVLARRINPHHIERIFNALEKRWPTHDFHIQQHASDGKWWIEVEMEDTNYNPENMRIFACGAIVALEL